MLNDLVYELRAMRLGGMAMALERWAQDPRMRTARLWIALLK